jgi:hypothetical protein
MSQMNLTAMNLASHGSSHASVGGLTRPKPSILDRFLNPLRTWIDSMEITDRETARLVCKLIPGQCPFERDVVLLGRTLAHIPPMCKINPLYEQFVGLRFRSLCYLVDVCGETMPS